ncbi:hypothetical protein SAMN05444417_1151 [Wenxinia saemankumensis]|uniref:Uncharacterized protein n=2 Tax=Wenxinia saemankumensis TaxID=1447782 RepID=A0A1M6CEP3_9RHOB|nr:hypothetical protein SAMN05444417_1151 [Wenxinia saemankumensis]
MHRTAPLAPLLLLLACGDGQPLEAYNLVDESEVEPGDVDPRDPNTTVSNRFLFDLDRNLTMNAVDYDAANDELVINNLPFDGPAGRYDRIGGLPTDGTTDIAGLYASRETPTTGQVQSYAVFLRSDELEATAANGAEWIGFGYGGANLNRERFGLPDGGEYVYVGVYSGMRSFDDRGGLELVTGETRLLLDILDLDPSGTIQGSILANIEGRSTSPVSGTGPAYALPDVVMSRIDFTTETGAFEGGAVSTFNAEGDEIGSGEYEGLIAGTNGDEIGAFLSMEGVAREQRISYEVVEYTYTETVTTDVAGLPLIQTITRTGSASALDQVGTEALQARADRRETIGQLTVDTSGFPEGYEITSSGFETATFSTDYDARELGVTITGQVRP